MREVEVWQYGISVGTQDMHARHSNPTILETFLHKTNLCRSSEYNLIVA